MNTFLPYADFERSAQCLDYRRLGKQRVESWQIYCCLIGQGSLAWRNHPAVKMWKGYENSLLEYGIAICNEWIKRGYKDSLLLRFQYALSLRQQVITLKYLCPKWLGDAKFHLAMRSNLLRKDKKWYSQFGWTEPDNLPYVWPI